MMRLRRNMSAVLMGRIGEILKLDVGKPYGLQDIFLTRLPKIGPGSVSWSPPHDVTRESPRHYVTRESPPDVDMQALRERISQLKRELELCETNNQKLETRVAKLEEGLRLCKARVEVLEQKVEAEEDTRGVLRAFGDYIGNVNDHVKDQCGSGPKGETLTWGVLGEQLRIERKNANYDPAKYWNDVYHSRVKAALLPLGLGPGDWRIGGAVIGRRNIEFHEDLIRMDTAMREQQMKAHVTLLGKETTLSTDVKASLMKYMNAHKVAFS